jgi:hypothetical protein
MWTNFLPACTYVQRGSKFCFVLVVVFVLLVLVLGDTLIKLQWQDTKLQWQDTNLQWQDTKLHARCAMSRSGRSPNCATGHQTERALLSRQVQTFPTIMVHIAALPGSLARQPCPAALPGSLARQPCPAALPGSLARQPCPAAWLGSLARQPCPAALPGSLAPAALQKYYSLNNRRGRRPTGLQAFLRS